MTGQRGRELLALHVPFDAAAHAIEAHPDYRIVRRIVADGEGRRPGPLPAELSVCVVCLTTTGSDPASDAIIELALQIVRIDERGVIVDSGPIRSWLNDPGALTPSQVGRLTGLTAADVRGRAISLGEAYGLISGVDLVVSHDAASARPFIEGALDLRGQAWMCSMEDVRWAWHGFLSRSQPLLLLQLGWFYAAGRAAGELAALVRLLASGLPDGRPVMKELVETAALPTWRLDLRKVPLSAEGILRERGYRWRSVDGCWRREVADGAQHDEIRWAAEAIYRGRRSPVAQRITWRERYSA